MLAAIAALKEPDRSIAKRLHAIIKDCAPTLMPKTWYGFPAYARDGKIVCFFQYAQKFNTRYAELGFNDAAHLDDGNMWPVRLRVEGADRCRGGKNPRSGEKSGELRTARNRRPRGCLKSDRLEVCGERSEIASHNLKVAGFPQGDLRVPAPQLIETPERASFRFGGDLTYFRILF